MKHQKKKQEPYTLLKPCRHPGPQRKFKLQGKVSPTDYIIKLWKKQRDEQTLSDVRNYAALTNTELAKTKRGVLVVACKGTRLGKDKAQVAAAVRKAHPKEFPHKNVVAGHVPDSALSGKAHGVVGILAMTRKANSIVGGGLWSRVGKRITRILVEEKKGYLYHY